MQAPETGRGKWKGRPHRQRCGPFHERGSGESLRPGSVPVSGRGRQEWLKRGNRGRAVSWPRGEADIFLSISCRLASISCRRQQDTKYIFNRICGGRIPHELWVVLTIGDNHEDSSQIGHGIDSGIFGIRFRRVGGVRRTGGANHASREVLPAV